MDNYMIAILVFFISIFLSRMISQKATKQLSSEKKAELVDLFSKSSIISIVIIIVLILLFYLIHKFNIVNADVAIKVYMALLIIFVIANAIYSSNILKSNQFPNNYIKTYLLSTSIRFIGILVFFGLLFM